MGMTLDSTESSFTNCKPSLIKSRTPIKSGVKIDQKNTNGDVDNEALAYDVLAENGSYAPAYAVA